MGSHQPAVDFPVVQPKRNPFVAIRGPQLRSGDRRHLLCDDQLGG